MAFSYSDKNFTVIGNLCFVHIILDGTQRMFRIPPAINDRILFNNNNNIAFVYAYLDENRTPKTSFAGIMSGVIVCSDVGVGYLSFYFPIDSNK